MDPGKGAMGEATSPRLGYAYAYGRFLPCRRGDDQHKDENGNVSIEGDRSHVKPSSSHNICRCHSAPPDMRFPWLMMSGNSAGKLAQLPIHVLSVMLFPASTALHFTHKESLAQFFVSTLALIPVSVTVQFVVKNITLNLQQRDYELLSGLFSGILGYRFPFQVHFNRS